MKNHDPVSRPCPRPLMKTAMRTLLAVLLIGMPAGVHAGAEVRVHNHEAAENHAVDADPFMELLQRIDPATDAVLLMSNLRQASDQLMHLLEGMNRDQLLIGSRPIDQLLSALDIPTQVAEHRGAAVLLQLPAVDQMPGGLNVSRLLTEALFLVPVRDADAFLNANFSRNEADGSVTHGSGRTMYARTLVGGGHVLLGFDRARVERYQPGGVAERWFRGLGDEGFARLRSGSVLFVGGHKAMYGWQHVVSQMQPPMLGSALNRGMDVFLQHAWPRDGLFAVSLDFDPLALIVREVFSFDASDSEPGRSSRDGELGLLQRLPDRPHYLIAGFDLRQPAMRSLLQWMMRWGADHPLPEWFETVERVELGVYQPAETSEGSPLTGGLLSHSAVVLHTRDSAALRVRMREWYLAQSIAIQAAAVPGRSMQVSWQDHQTLSDGAIADVVQVQCTWPADDPFSAIGQAMLLGPSGWRGHVLEREGSLLITFSRREVTRQWFDQTRHGRAPAMEENPVLQTMGMWFPQRASAVMLVPIGANLAVLSSVLERLPRVGEAGDADAALAWAWPAVPLGLPPVGIALDVVDRVGGADGQTIDIVGSTTVIPAQLLTIGVDELMQRMRTRMDAGGS